MSCKEVEGRGSNAMLCCFWAEDHCGKSHFYRNGDGSHLEKSKVREHRTRNRWAEIGQGSPDSGALWTRFTYGTRSSRRGTNADVEGESVVVKVFRSSGSIMARSEDLRGKGPVERDGVGIGRRQMDGRAMFDNTADAEVSAELIQKRCSCRIDLIWHQKLPVRPLDIKKRQVYVGRSLGEGRRS